MNTMSTPTAQLVAGLLIGAAVVAAFAIGGDLSSALVSGGLVVAFVLFVYFGRRRSEAIEVMSGIGDERTRSLYRDACAGRAEHDAQPAVRDLRRGVGGCGRGAAAAVVSRGRVT
jgi:hypothetical protein